MRSYHRVFMEIKRRPDIDDRMANKATLGEEMTSARR